MMEQSQIQGKKNGDARRQIILYFSFAIAMILLNYIIQKSNQILIAPWVCTNMRHINIIDTFYCAQDPYNMTELVGSVAAVGITYIVKFLLDKFVVFEKKSTQLKETSEQFIKYFIFAIITTIENIGIQFLLTNFIGTPLEISLIIALSIGYITKFLLDRRYVFAKSY